MLLDASGWGTEALLLRQRLKFVEQIPLPTTPISLGRELECEARWPKGSNRGIIVGEKFQQIGAYIGRFTDIDPHCVVQAKNTRAFWRVMGDRVAVPLKLAITRI